MFIPVLSQFEKSTLSSACLSLSVRMIRFANPTPDVQQEGKLAYTSWKTRKMACCILFTR